LDERGSGLWTGWHVLRLQAARTTLAIRRQFGGDGDRGMNACPKLSDRSIVAEAMRSQNYCVEGSYR
jgi:hypothetical protein